MELTDANARSGQFSEALRMWAVADRPAGVGPLVPGDVVEVEIERVGLLRNPVV